MSTIRWNQANTYTNGAPFGVAEFGGYELQINGQPAVSIPVGYDADGEYEFLFDSLGRPPGRYTIALRVVDKAGTASEFSEAVVFDFAVAPSRPTNLSVVA